MKRSLSLALCLALVAFAATAFAAGDEPAVRDYSGYNIAVEGPNVIQHSSGTADFSKAAGDTFYIYGGPSSVGGFWPTGMFQSLELSPGGTPETQGWVGVDLTETNPNWRVSTTNADQGFTTAGPNNHAAIDHDPQFPGYGNSWNDWLVLELDLTAIGLDPNVSHDMRVTGEYKYDTEACCDFVTFDWNQAGSWQEIFATSGSTLDTLGVYQAELLDETVTYNPGDYVGGTSVAFRVRFQSDTGWSDEDGLYSSAGRGAVALDNMTVYVDGTPYSIADFEPLAPGNLDNPVGDMSGANVGADVGTAGWQGVPADFVGDFSKIYGQFQDIDPCRDNVTPQFTFIDDGTPPSNGGGVSTGGSVSPTWSYGVPGGYVINYTGGLTNGTNALSNEIWSPAFDWDLPGTADDVSNGGAVLGFTRWSHMPLTNGIFAQWHVRSYTTANGWSGWEDNSFVYYSNAAAYGNFTVDVTDKLQSNPEQVQIAMAATDLAGLFGFPGTDATPAPNFDNIYLKKYVIGGPVFSTRTIDIASDGFPNDGTLTGAIRWDANIDIGPTTGTANVPGDSIAVDIIAIIPGTALADSATGGTMKVAHLVNPDFGDINGGARQAGLAAVGASLAGTDPQTGWDIYTYDVPGNVATTSTGEPIADRYFFDLPDGPTVNFAHHSPEPALFFPGDVMHYYIESTDDATNTSTLPNDTTDFLNFQEGTLYNRVWTVRGLPTVVGTQQPRVLFWNDFGHRGGEEEYLQAFRQNGMVEGVHYDTYTTKGPSSGVGNGLGSAGFHGANALQLAGYDCMVYVSGDLADPAISDGSNENGNDKGNDVATLTDWHNQAGDRFHVYFGDDLASAMIAQGLNSQTYLNNVLGVDGLSDNVVPKIDGQSAAKIVPTGNVPGAFLTEYVAYGGCLVINDFDEVGPFGTGPVIGHEFTDPSGNPYGTTVAGSIWWDRNEGGFRKVTALFPYDLLFIRNPIGTTGTGVSARAALMSEIFAAWGKSGVGGPAIGTGDLPKKLTVSQNYPNPFNPSTTIKFAMPAKGKVSVRVYNVRGELVSTLFDGVKEAGPHSVMWNGKDANGASVSTGVYLYQVATKDAVVNNKMVMIK